MRPAKKQEKRQKVRPKKPIYAEIGMRWASHRTVAILYFILTVAITYPLIFRMRSSTYSPTDHISTDVYGTLRIFFWWIKYSIWNLHHWPAKDLFLAAPYGQYLSYGSLTGFVMLPITLMVGKIAANNVLIILGYFLSALFTYYLVYHLTRDRLASFGAGVILAFSPLMLLRGYTTFDTIQVQWLPLYILYLFKFTEERTWRNITMLTLALVAVMFLSFPYYLIFLPLVTVVFIVVRWAVYGKDQKSAGKPMIKLFLAGSRFSDLIKVVAGGGLALIAFVLFYFFILKMPGDLPKVSSPLPVRREISQQVELRLEPKDYFVPVQESAVFGEYVKDYWLKVYREERRNSINSAAYIGYVALLLALYGICRRRDWKMLFFGIVGMLAFLTTLGPYLSLWSLRLPTPAWFMFQMAPFVRRINIYKIYVQLAMAVFAGVGLSYLLEKFKRTSHQAYFTAGLFALIALEYTIVPPFITTDLRRNPSVYTWLANAPGDSIVLEYPMRKAWGADYQGYYYYQTLHKRKLFNGDIGSSYIPLEYRAFWEDMEVPAALADYNNQALLSYFGVQYVLKHYRNQSKTVILRSLPQPSFEELLGLRLAYESPDFKQEYRDFSPRFYWQHMGQLVDDPKILDYPHDYIWTNIFEVIAEPATVMLKWDYRSPYPKAHEASEYFAVRLSEHERSFYPPTMMFFNGQEWIPIQQFDAIQSLREQAALKGVKMDLRAWRVMKKDGIIWALNLLDEEDHFDMVFDAVSFGQERTLEVFVEGGKVAELQIGTLPKEFVLKDVRLQGEEEKTIRFHSPEGMTQIPDGQGGTWNASVAFHNFRVFSGESRGERP